MDFPAELESPRQSLSREILGHVTEALREFSSTERITRPVLRFQLFVEDADDHGDDECGNCDGAVPATCRLLISRRLDLSGITESAELGSQARAPSLGVGETDQDSLATTATPPLPSPTLCPSNRSTSCPDSPRESTRRRKGISGLRPVRADITVVDGIDTQRQMQVLARSFPKRSKIDKEAVASLKEASLDKFIVGIWEHIHGGADLDPQSILEQWQAAASAAGSTGAATMGNMGRNPGFGLLPAMASPAEVGGSFNQSNAFCRKVTQASRTCRSIEVVVQARWIEHFESYVNFMASSNPSMSTKKCRKAVLLEACKDFGWTEKDMRNRMRIWSGYKELKDAGGWAAIVFAGMGIYRFCKYRIGFDAESVQGLRALRPRIEVAADTLHPNWRHLLAVVGESSEARFTGHLHDWVVFPCGSEPVPLRSTYLERHSLFNFEHLDESIVDVHTRGPCPMLNTLANHGFIPRSGRGIQAGEITSALHDAVGVSWTAALLFTLPIFFVHRDPPDISGKWWKSWSGIRRMVLDRPLNALIFRWGMRKPGQYLDADADADIPDSDRRGKRRRAKVINLDQLGTANAIEHDISLTRRDRGQSPGGCMRKQPDLVQGLLDFQSPDPPLVPHEDSGEQGDVQATAAGVSAAATASSPPLTLQDLAGYRRQRIKQQREEAATSSRKIQHGKMEH